MGIGSADHRGHVGRAHRAGGRARDVFVRRPRFPSRDDVGATLGAHLFKLRVERLAAGDDTGVAEAAGFRVRFGRILESVREVCSFDQRFIVIPAFAGMTSWGSCH